MDDIFAYHRRQMQAMHQRMQHMLNGFGFGGFGGFGDAFGFGSGFGRRGGFADPFFDDPFFSDPFRSASDMISQFPSSNERSMRNSSGTTHVITSSYSYSSDGVSAPVIKHAAHRSVRVGDMEESQTVTHDSATGQSAVSHSRRIGERGVRRDRRRNADGTFVDEEKLSHLNPDEVSHFQDEWEKSSHRLPGGGVSALRSPEFEAAARLAYHGPGASQRDNALENRSSRPAAIRHEPSVSNAQSSNSSSSKR